MNFRALSLLAPLLLLAEARAVGPFLLFHQGRPVEDCMKLKETPLPRQVRFSDGKVLLVTEFLGEGNMTCVLRLGTGEALRVRRIGPDADPASIRSYLRGYEAIRERGLAIPRLLGADTGYYEYAIMERVEVRFTLEEWFEAKRLFQRGEMQTLQYRAEKSPAWRELVEILQDEARTREVEKGIDRLIVSTFAFREIADFGVRQVAWTGKQMVLLDWGSWVSLARDPFDATLSWRIGLAFDGLNREEQAAWDLRIARLRERYCGELLRPDGYRAAPAF